MNNPKAKQLSKKFIDAEYEYRRSLEHLERLEQEIADSMIGEEALEKWKAWEQEFVEKVVSMKNHADLKNPYEPKQEQRTLCF